MGGGQFKAFTLIELLAIIVILAIIAVITIPIILNVIENANKGSAIDSAYGYKDAIEKYYVSKLYEDQNFKFEDRMYFISELESMGVSALGNNPTADSWVELKNNEIVTFSLKIGDYIVTKDENGKVTAVKGTEIIDPNKNNAIKIAQEIISNIEYLYSYVYSIDDILGWVLDEAVVPSELKEGWVAGSYDNTTVGYSLKIEQNGKNYIVTSDNESITCVEGETLASSEIGEKLITTEVVNKYLAGLMTKAQESTFIENVLHNAPDVVLDISYNHHDEGIESKYDFPNSAWVRLSYNEDAIPKVSITDLSIIVGTYDINEESVEYAFNYDNTQKDNLDIQRNGTFRKKPIIWTNVACTEKADERCYYASDFIDTHPIYFDPVNNSVCTEEEYNNNADKLGKTGCMKWYAYSQNKNKSEYQINMILNHNTSNNIQWISESDYDEGNGIPYKAISLGLRYPNATEDNPFGIFNGEDKFYYRTWNKGPITLLSQLENDTKNWKTEGPDKYCNRNNLYDNSNPDNLNYCIKYTKAGLISAQEINYIANLVHRDDSSSDFDERIGQTVIAGEAYFNRNSSSITYPWLVENLHTNSNQSLPYGYWTSSPDASDDWAIWAVSYSYDLCSEPGDVGVRPVIAVSSSVLSAS